jgi:hypothetical protein
MLKHRGKKVSYVCSERVCSITLLHQTIRTAVSLSHSLTDRQRVLFAVIARKRPHITLPLLFTLSFIVRHVVLLMQHDHISAHY